MRMVIGFVIRIARRNLIRKYSSKKRRWEKEVAVIRSKYVKLLSKYTMRKIKQNLFWAFVYNSVGIPLAAGAFYPLTGWLLSPIIAGAAMAFSSVSVLSNSLLMKNYKPKIK